MSAKLQLKNNQLESAREIIHYASFYPANEKFNYASRKNEQLIQEQINHGTKLSMPAQTDEFEKFEEARMLVVKEFSKVDEKGNPVINKLGNFDIENIEEFEKRIEELKKKFPLQGAAMDESWKLLQEWNNADFIVKLYKVLPEFIPELPRKMQTKDGRTIPMYDFFEDVMILRD